MRSSFLKINNYNKLLENCGLRIEEIEDIRVYRIEQFKAFLTEQMKKGWWNSIRGIKSYSLFTEPIPENFSFLDFNDSNYFLSLRSYYYKEKELYRLKDIRNAARDSRGQDEMYLSLEDYRLVNTPIEGLGLFDKER